MSPMRYAVLVVLLLAAGLLGGGLSPQAASAQQGPPPEVESPPFHLAYDGLLDATRLPTAAAAQDAAGQDAAAAPLPQEYASWSKLVFQSARNEHDWEVWGALGDGSNQANLSNNANMDIHPRLNRAATRVVFASNRKGKYEIYAMNADGSGPTRLTSSGADNVYPAWSPDGSRIAFQSYRDGQAEIYVMGANGSHPTRLTNYGDYDGQPAWSPDGSRIAFVRPVEGANRIWVMNADGSNARRLSSQASSENPAWSPDGSQIAYDANANGDSWQEIWLMDAVGGNQREVYRPPEPNTDAWVRSWSPDGRYIAFTRISFIQEGGKWYWTTAYLDAWDPSGAGGALRLSGDGADWNPDWRSIELPPPTSGVQPLPVQSPATFAVSWTGTAASPAGIAGYDIQVRDGAGGVWTDWQTTTQAQAAPYTGSGGHTYYFRSRARDAAGHLEPWPADYDAFTTVEALPPQTSMAALAPYSRNGFQVQWGGSDPGNSGIASYDVQVRRDAGVWTDWLMGTTETAAGFDGTPGAAYGFRVRAKDKAQNVAAWPAAADATTTLYTWAIKGHVTDNRGAPVVDMATTTVPAAFLATPSDVEGAYAAHVTHEAGNYTVNWDKAAYGVLPGTAFPPAQDAATDLVLPPADNAVHNWGFEGGAASWQFGGNLTGMITGTDRHSGAAAAFLGTNVAPLQSITTLAGPGLQGESLYMDSAIDATDVLHVVWIGPDHHVTYRSRPSTGVWSLPDTLPGPVALYDARPKILVDNAGTIHVVWSGDYTTYYSWKKAGEDWWNSEGIPGSSNTYEKPGLALGLDGTVKVVWATQGYGDLYYRQRSPDGVWSSMRIISDTYGPDVGIKMATDSSGLAHLAWSGSDISGYADVLYTAETGDGSWLPAVNVSQYEYHLTGWDMVIDSHDRVHVVWNADALYYRTLSPGTSWSPKQRVASSGFGGVSLCADALDRIHLAWGDASASQVRYAVRSNLIWSGPEDVASPTPISLLSNPSLVVDANNKLHVLWLQYQNLNIWTIHYSVKDYGGQWSPPVDVYQNDHDTETPQLLVDRSGIPHALWRTHVEGYSVLHAGPGALSSAGEATMSQVVQVPAAKLAPTLSFQYIFGAVSPTANSLEVLVDDGASPAVVFSSTTGKDSWTHQWVDLTPWAGRLVTLRFRLAEWVGSLPAWAYIDEVTVGSAHPDTWVSRSGRRAALPGEQFVQIINYGNRGGVAATNGHVTLQLPPELVYIGADPPPSAVSSGLRWDVGDLAAGSGPATIQVTLQMMPSAAFGATFVSTANIAGDTAELEEANNMAQASTVVGSLVYLPLVERH